MVLDEVEETEGKTLLGHILVTIRFIMYCLQTVVYDRPLSLSHVLYLLQNKGAIFCQDGCCDNGRPRRVSYHNPPM